LQHTVAAVVSAPSPDIGLERILAAAARAMHAPSYLLVTEASSSVKARMLSIGLEPVQAERIAREIPQQMDRDVPGRIVVSVASTRQHYGWLAAIDTENRRFLQREREVVGSYAGLAAAALDSATALEEAHRQATTTGTLLDLSRSLASVLSTEDMASVLARAVPNVVDCDRSIVLLVDSDTDETRIAATYGYPAEADDRLRGSSLACTVANNMEPTVAFYEARELAALNEQYGLSIGQDSVAMASVPMIANGATIGGLIVAVTDNPDRLQESLSLSDVLRGLSGQGAMAICNARLVDQIRHQALHDGLTGLPNRMLVLDRVEQALAKARREGDSVGTMFIDLDGFKDINDSLGHAAGDQLLTILAMRLQSVVRQGDTIGRLGGDEFVAIFDGPSLIAGPQIVAQRILEVVREPFELAEFSGKQLSITASIGIAIGDRPTAGELLRDADIALYRAKLNGKNCHVLFHPDMAQTSRNLFEIGRSITVAEELRAGPAAHRLEV
jgi:diguanylate cyclase (GGDEF)-like protein